MREDTQCVRAVGGERHLRRAARHVASAPELRQPIVALSLGGLRRRIEIAMLPDDVRVVLQLDGHAATHPEFVIAVMNAASSDWAASRLAVAIERVAEALLVEGEEAQQHIVPARELLRARP
jgi:hypothetical protein